MRLYYNHTNYDHFVQIKPGKPLGLICAKACVLQADAKLNMKTLNVGNYVPMKIKLKSLYFGQGKSVTSG